MEIITSRLGSKIPKTETDWLEQCGSATRDLDPIERNLGPEPEGEGARAGGSVRTEAAAAAAI